MEYEISAEALKQKMQAAPFEASASEFCLLDVREPWETSLGTIPGARLIPMGDLPSRAHQELDPDAHIVVYCHHGARSLSATVWLREQGFTRAQSMAGGIDAWSQKVDPSVPRY